VAQTGTRLLILGTRLLAEEVTDLASDAGLEVVGYVENLDRERCAAPLLGLPVHWIDDAAVLAADHVAVCALTTTTRSRYVEQAAALGFRFGKVVHPTARISRTSAVGDGAILSAGVIVASHTTLGSHVVANRGVLVGHHTQIGDFVTLQPGANVAGACRIGAGVYIGMGAIVLERRTVGAGSVIGAGAVVTRDVPRNVQVLGVPARIVKEGVDGL
jgi:acetyltransferase EpsM